MCECMKIPADMRLNYFVEFLLLLLQFRFKVENDDEIKINFGKNLYDDSKIDSGI